MSSVMFYKEFLSKISKNRDLLDKDFSHTSFIGGLDLLFEDLKVVSSIRIENIFIIKDYFNDSNYCKLPSSINYNYNYSGGLYYHSVVMGVYLASIVESINSINKDKQLDVSPQEAMFIGLFHDICKTKEFNIDSINGSFYEDTTIKGHASISLSLINKLGITGLSDVVVQAILHHMGHWGDSFGKKYLEKYQDHPLIGLSHIVDTMATFWIDGR